MSPKSITLAFSCLGERLPALIEHLESLNTFSHIQFLLIVQKPLKTTSKYLNLAHANIVLLDSIGLSKSRNAAIEHATTDYIWFLDDDVLLNNDNIQQVSKIINSNSADFYRAQIGCTEWLDKKFKNYKKNTKLTKLNLLQFSSIEVIANLTLIKKHKLFFNEKIGLGTLFKACEENNFLIDAWNKGARFKFIDQVLVRHTCIFEERILATHEIFEIRGATASRYGALGPLLVIRWTFRYLIKEKKLSFITSMLKGYIKGYKAYL